MLFTFRSVVASLISGGSIHIRHFSILIGLQKVVLPDSEGKTSFRPFQLAPVSLVVPFRLTPEASENLLPKFSESHARHLSRSC